MKLMPVAQMSTKTAKRSFGEEVDGFEPPKIGYSDRMSYWQKRIGECIKEYEHKTAYGMNKYDVGYRIDYAYNELNVINDAEFKNKKVSLGNYLCRQIEIGELVEKSQNKLNFVKQIIPTDMAIHSTAKNSTNGFISKIKNIVKLIFRAK